MSSPVPKYVMNQAGIPVLNPEYTRQQQQQQSTASGSPPPALPPRPGTNQPQPLAIVSTIDDQAEMSAITQLPLPQQLQNTIQQVQSPQYIQQFHSKNPIDGGDLIDGLTAIFQRLEVPMGLLSKLTILTNKILIFTIDDSGSMIEPSNLLFQDACPYMKELLMNANLRLNANSLLSRWQEAEDRLYVVTEILAYIPISIIILKTFDHNQSQNSLKLMINRTGQTPPLFLSEIRSKIRSIFSHRPNGGTPIYANLYNSLQEGNRLRQTADGQIFHYMLSDGHPSNGEYEIKQIKDLLMSSTRQPQYNPITFLGCSNQRSEYQWMHEMEEIAPFVATLPDFRDEFNDVKKAQGQIFPYSRGLWIICNLVAVVNPQDLDGLDEDCPLSKLTMENLMGRGLVESEYQQYFNLHPDGRIFAPEYPLFLSSPSALQIQGVQVYNNTLRQLLSRDIDGGDDNSDDREKIQAQQTVIQYYRQRGMGTQNYNSQPSGQYGQYSFPNPSAPPPPPYSQY